MNSNNNAIKSIKKTTFFYCLLIWIIFSIFYVYFRNHESLKIVSGFMAFGGELVLNFVIMTLCFSIWAKAQQKEKGIFILFSIIFFLEAINGLVYNLIINILGSLSFSTSFDLICSATCTLSMVISCIVWFLIFNKKRPRGNFMVIFFCILLFLIIFTLLYYAVFNTTWIMKRTSFEASYVTWDTILQGIAAVFLIINLFLNKEKEFYFVIIGFLVVLTSSIAIHSFIVKLQIIQDSFWECVWILGLILILYGFGCAIKSSTLKNGKLFFTDNRVNENN